MNKILREAHRKRPGLGKESISSKDGKRRGKRRELTEFLKGGEQNNTGVKGGKTVYNQEVKNFQAVKRALNNLIKKEGVESMGLHGGGGGGNC